jgi:hypothetical protein
MNSNRRPNCSVFSDQEIAEARKVPVMMKIIIGLFLAILAGIFMPFHTVSDLSKNVGALTAVQIERQNSYLRNREQDEARLKKFEKKLYWIDRNLQDATTAIKNLKNFLAAESSSKIKFRQYGRLGSKDIPSTP